MEIKWLGHSSFLITSKNGTKIITDPFGRGFLGIPASLWRMGYDEANEEADIVTISHGHWDHRNVKSVLGNPQIVNKTGVTITKGIHFKGIPSRHGMPWANRRENVIFCFEVDGIRLCHLGDIGEVLNGIQLREIGKTDVLFVPVGGFMTVGPVDAAEICRRLNPRLIIPMHYRNEQCKFPFFVTVEDFIDHFPRDIYQSFGGEIEVTKDSLPKEGNNIVIFSKRRSS